MTEHRSRPHPSCALLLAAGCALLAHPAVSQASPASACNLDLAPAATLLLPFFEVDLAHDGGRTTLFSLVNTEDAATVASVTLWTDLGVPTLHFNVYLTGYDTQTINLRDLLAGRLPATASDGQDPNDRISPQGAFSQDVDFSACQGLLPPPALSDSVRAALLAAHTGGFVDIFGGCAAQPFGDGIARGYLTADVVHTCTARTPADPGYFGAGGSGDASDANVLWGDFVLIDPAGASAVGEPLVRVQAFPGRFLTGQATFYGRHLGHSAVDDREPLATTWGARFVQRGSFSGGTDLLVWRDPGQPSQPFACTGGRPPWYPLTIQAVTFDEQESAGLADGCGLTTCPPTAIPTPLAAMAQRVPLADASFIPGYGSPLPIPFDFGWLYLLFPRTVAESPVQAWVGQLMSASDRFAVGLEATPLDSACELSPPPPPGW